MKLKAGVIYHWLGYEDEDISRPMITSVEYLGLDVVEVEEKAGGSRHFFRIVGSDEKLMFAKNNLPELVDVPGLIEQLHEFRSGRYRLPPDKR